MRPAGIHALEMQSMDVVKDRQTATDMPVITGHSRANTNWDQDVRHLPGKARHRLPGNWQAGPNRTALQVWTRSDRMASPDLKEGAGSLTYSPSSRALQDQHDTRRLADRLVAVKVHEEFTVDDRQFIERLDRFFLATVNADGVAHEEVHHARRCTLPAGVKVVRLRDLAWVKKGATLKMWIGVDLRTELGRGLTGLGGQITEYTFTIRDGKWEFLKVGAYTIAS